jgi:hypothetical protein
MTRAESLKHRVAIASGKLPPLSSHLSACGQRRRLLKPESLLTTDAGTGGYLKNFSAEDVNDPNSPWIGGVSLC